MTKIAMNAKEADVKSILGFTDQEWRLLQVDARHEYDSHVETFDPRKTWKDINFEQKKESIKRLRDKHDEPKGFAIEWMLHRRHLAASQTFKNHQKAQIMTASVSSSENNSSTSASKMYDPVKDAAGAARE